MTALDDGWFERHGSAAAAGLEDGLGAMKLRFSLDEPIDTTQDKLLVAARSSQIRTFGWPHGVVFDSEDWRPRAVPDSIFAEVPLSLDRGHGRDSYDY